MEEQSEIVRSKKEFAFASSTILSQVGRGIIVGLIVGIIVGSFRFLIEKGFHLIPPDTRSLSRSRVLSAQSFCTGFVLYTHLLAQCQTNTVRKRY